MMSYFSAYGIIFVLFLISITIGVILYFISYFFISKNYNFEKTSSYECGFDPFSDITIPFEVKYYLVAILFIIFDLEVSFLFPWTIVFFYIGFYGFFAMIIFLFVLTLGFIYEWLQGALEWN